MDLTGGENLKNQRSRTQKFIADKNAHIGTVTVEAD